MTRAEATAMLVETGWGPEEIATMSDALLDWIATDLADRWTQGNRPGTFGTPYPQAGPATRTPLPELDDPTPEEIARAMHGHFIPCSALKGAKIAREIKRRELEAEGRAISQNPAHSAATVRALATIVRVGTGQP